MNAKAIALFAVLAVALTGGFAIVGADAADADDFKAEYMTAGPLEGVQITFDVAPYDKIDWLGTVYEDEGTIVKNVLLKFDGNKTAIAWKAKPLAVGTYQVEITDKDQTTTYKGSFVVPEKFTVTFAVDDAVVKTLTVDDGDYIAADQLPEDPVKGGQEFVGWAPEGATVAFDFANTPITQDYDFKALFKPKEYNIAVDPAIQNGTVTPSKAVATMGETIALTVTPAEGYQTVSVTVDGVAIEGNTFEMPAKDVTVSATFEAKEYTITVDPAIVNGTVIPDKEKAKMGDTVTLTVTAAEGYQTVSVTVDGVAIEGNTFEMPAKDVTVSATFDLKEYTITVDPEIQNGTVTPSKLKAKAGEAISLTVLPAEGYQVASVTLDGAALEEYAFTMPAKDVTVSATFELKDYTISVDPAIVNGTVVADKEKAKAGEIVTLTVTADEGYEIASVTVDGVEIEGSSFTMPNKNVTVSATFELIPVPYEAAVYLDEKIIADDFFLEGEDVSFDLSEHIGLGVTASVTGPEDVEFDFTDGVLSFEMPAKDVDFELVLTPIVPDFYDVIVSELIENGTVNADPVKAVEGTTVTLTATPDEGYVLKSCIVYTLDQQDVPVADDGTFVMPASDVYVEATFVPETTELYTVSYVDQDGETIAADVTYEAGEAVYFEVPVRTGANPVKVETTPVIEDLDYDLDLMAGGFTMPASDVTVTVTYEAFVPETVNVVFMDGETVIATETVVVGSYLTKIPNDPVHEGKIFLGWCREGSDVPYDFATMPVLENMTLVATYEDAPVEDVTLTFRVEGAQYAVATFPVGTAIPEDKIPGEPVKEGYNFVGWFKDGFEQSFDFTAPVYEDVTLFAKYIETPLIEGFAVLYHDMYQGEPVDIWWKGYASKDDRVMLANGMDATPGVVFKGWLAEDQKTLLTWNAAYDLNDLDRNDCLIYPAYYGYPGTDGIYELNAIYELHIQWIGFDGETVIDEQDVERGKFLVPKYSDEAMTSMLEQEMPSDKQYKYSWTGWRIGDSETTYTSEQIGSVKVDGAWKIYATYGKDLNEYDITFKWHDGTSTIRVPYGDTPEIENPPAYEDDNFTYTFAGWDPEVKKVDGDATYTATYDKTSKTNDVTITVNDFAYGYFTYNDEKQNADYILKVPMDAEAPVIDGNILTFDFVRYEGGDEVSETHVFTAFPNPDDTMHYEFIEWTVSEDGNTYTANFVTDIITSKDLDRIQTFFDYTKTEGGDVVFTLKSKDGLAIPKGTMTVWYYEIAYLEDIEDWVQIERSCDAIAMDWDEETYGDNLISMTIEYADLTQDGEAFDITSKTISTMWLVFDGVNGAHCESNKATPGQ